MTDHDFLNWLRDHYYGADFQYGDAQMAVIVFGPLPDGVKLSGSFFGDMARITKAEDV